MSDFDDYSSTRTGRIRKLTEKGKNYQLQILEDERLSAHRSWRKQLNKLSNLIADSTNVDLLKSERTFLETKMEILNAANEKLYDSLEDNFDAKKEFLMKCETLECEHSNTLRKANERISEIKQEIGSYSSKRSGRDSQEKKSNGSSAAASLIKKTAIAASVARLKTSALKEYEDELKKFQLEKKLALAKAEMEAVIKREDEESENFAEDKNLPKEIDKN